MKKIMFTVLTTVFFGCFLGKAQSSTNNGIVGSTPPTTTPASISQFEVDGLALTQNSQSFPSGAQITGSFDPTARWNFMGNINYNTPTPNLTQTINGFRTQTDGRGLAWGHSIPAPSQPNAGIVSNSFIEWIGNKNFGVAPGNLEFRYAYNPAGASSASGSGFIPSLIFIS